MRWPMGGGNVVCHYVRIAATTLAAHIKCLHASLSWPFKARVWEDWIACMCGGLGWRKPKLKFRKSVILCECTHIDSNSNIMKLIEWQEIPARLHIIRSSSIAQFLGSYGKMATQIFWQYISVSILLVPFGSKVSFECMWWCGAYYLGSHAYDMFAFGGEGREVGVD